MGITAGHRHAWLGEPKLRSDYMNDPLAATANRLEADAVLCAIALKGGKHLFGQRVGEWPGLGGGGHDVVHRRHGALGMANAQTQTLQG